MPANACGFYKIENLKIIQLMVWTEIRPDKMSVQIWIKVKPGRFFFGKKTTEFDKKS